MQGTVKGLCDDSTPQSDHVKRNTEKHQTYPIEQLYSHKYKIQVVRELIVNWTNYLTRMFRCGLSLWRPWLLTFWLDSWFVDFTLKYWLVLLVRRGLSCLDSGDFNLTSEVWLALSRLVRWGLTCLGSGDFNLTSEVWLGLSLESFACPTRTDLTWLDSRDLTQILDRWDLTWLTIWTSGGTHGHT